MCVAGGGTGAVAKPMTEPGTCRKVGKSKKSRTFLAAGCDPKHWIGGYHITWIVEGNLSAEEVPAEWENHRKDNVGTARI